MAAFIQDYCGIKMPQSKLTMVSSRLLKRMRCLGFTSLKEYVDFVFSNEGIKAEIQHMVDVVTTNKTEFFREARHFEVLCQTIVPMLLKQKKFSNNKMINIWSAACSSGEEPYSIAISLTELAEKNTNLRFSVLASDICMQVLKKACQGVYDEERIKDVPLRLRTKYMLRSKDRKMRLVKLKPCIRDIVTFQRINLMSENFELKEKMDIIFCRNVMIYFDTKTQEALMYRFVRNMTPGGFLFTGHSESLNALEVPFKQLIPTVYQKIT